MVDSEHNAVSAMDECDVTCVGQPYGECALVWNSSWELAFQPITTTSKCLCVVVSHSHSVTLLIIYVYLSNDDNCYFSFDIFGEVLNEMSAIINLYDDYDIIMGGISM